MAASIYQRRWALPVLTCLLIVLQGGVPSQWSGPEACRSAEPAGASRLQELLLSESEGRSIDRRRSLGDTSVLSDQGMWHAGLIPLRDRIAKYEDLTQDEKSLRYETQLKSHSRMDVAAHINMAKWCEGHDEPMRAQGHWHAVLSSDANHPVARRALGHQQLDRRWFSPAELASAREAAERLTGDLVKWLPRMQRIAKQIASNSTSAKLKALKQLDEIDDLTAIAALEFAAQNSGQTVFVDKLASYGDPTSCQALSRLAIGDIPEAVRARAMQKLSGYPADFYVPDLLSQIASPVQSQTSLSALPNGSLALHQLAMVEVIDRVELHRYTKEFRRSNAQLQAYDESDSKRSYRRAMWIEWTPQEAEAARLERDRKRASMLVDKYVVGEQAVEGQAILNMETAALKTARQASNERIFRTLRTALQVNPGSTANAWWGYWLEEAEAYASPKPLTSYERYEVGAAEPDYELDSLSPLPRLRTSSCLVEGTLIQTSTGLKAVDQITAGELVMSQHIESGALCFKPVLAATVRPAGAILSIDLGDSTVQATPGHGWFVSGKGWVRAKMLKPGMMVHTARGNIEVQAVTRNAKPEEAYNLVVADTHTYFVGEHRLLSYDITPVVPTARPVPGFGQINFASK